MTVGQLTPGRGLAVDADALLRRAERAIKRARKSGEPVLLGLTVRVGSEVDPSAVVFASRAEGEDWFCFEQPDRAGSALAALGVVTRLTASGPSRFKQVSAAWRALAADAVADAPDGPPGAGLVAVGGFAFAPDGGRAPHWEGFSAADLVVPEVSLARRGDDVRLTVAALVAPDDVPSDLAERLSARVASLRLDPLPMLDPDPVGKFRVDSVAPPEHYEAAVARAVERIRAGAFEKIVLAREVTVQAPTPHDAAAVFGVLRSGFDSCYVFCAGRGDAAFIAASPELLVRRDGARAQTVALAGSTRRSADPAVDNHLGEQLLRSVKDREEQEIVVRRIAQALKPHAVWVAAPDEPTVIRVANIQHLATPIRAQLAHPLSAIELAALLHPTPAVGGEPHAAAVPLIPALEGLDRGWYAGAIGWTDANDDGEFCVALRCALLRGHEGRLYAGVGVVRDSDPASELAETEIKLGALLPVLSG
ncbi:isochorismate synthase [Solirubrobacter deserti]|uniref:isochorismate synthase n=1 Tax=Solirubrobacter deserti TaxID=2282478 RepID=A0ABT4RNQ6_9ACTN|nr:isochorismate synthase [Solirubrobacter deserti]MDA0139941.1 isochorismate synthase [Solirubrobacter deserti]